MKLYIKNYSSYRDDLEQVDFKKELKTRYKLDTRRQDRFIHLAVYGAQLLKDKCDINIYDELYVTSGVGNVDIVQKTNTYMYEENEPLKLFDFINLLGNTTSYYVAKSLGIKGKNIFQISDNFTYIHTLVGIYASILNSGNSVVLCSIDLQSNLAEITKRVLGLDEDTELASSVNFQKLSLDAKDAIATVEFEMKSYAKDEILELIGKSKSMIVSSLRCKKLDYKKQKKFFETEVSYEINMAIESGRDMLFVDCCGDRYKVVELKMIDI